MKDTKDIWTWVTEVNLYKWSKINEQWIPEYSESDMVGLSETDDGINSNGGSVQELFEKNKELMERKRKPRLQRRSREIDTDTDTNQNAKEFSLNPNAKEFTSRSPPSASGVAPTPPHPQTPHHPIIAGGVPGHQYLLPPVISMVMPVPGGPGGMIAGPGIVPLMSQVQTGPRQTQAPAMWSHGGPGQHPPLAPPQQGYTPGFPKMFSGPPGHNQPHSFPGGPGAGHLVVIPPIILPSAVGGRGQPHPHMGRPHMMGGGGQTVTQQFRYMPQQ